MFANEAASEIDDLMGLARHFDFQDMKEGSTSLVSEWKGRVYVVQCIPRSNAWACFLTDITELRQAHRRASHLASFPELNPSPVIEFASDGTCIYCNPSCKAQLPILETSGLKHPILSWIPKLAGDMIGQVVTREVEHEDCSFLVAGSFLPANRTLRAYIFDVTATRRAENKLASSRVELIERLAQAAEWRDNETGSHIKRMSKYCGVLALALGLDPEEAARIELAATMHDIGKIAVPDSILHKPGKLTDDEFREMRGHTIIGSKLLAGGDDMLLMTAAEIARWHHERWDGAGYPDGLKGEQIPLAARIAAVCDVFDALTSERPYKRAWDSKSALDEITSLAGTHFDPTVVDGFRFAFEDLLVVKETWSDSAGEVALGLAA